MKQIVILIGLLLFIPVAYAQWGCGVWGEGVWGGADCIPPSSPAEETPAPSTGPGGATNQGAGPVPGTTTVRKETQAAFCEDQVFVERLFSKCEIPENGICEDGENYLINQDCAVTLDSIREGDIFSNMWFLRFVLLISMFLLIRDSKSYPFVVIALLFLFMHNGAFIPSGVDYDPNQCMDVNALLNFGYCVTPTNPILGWAIGAVILFIFAGYIFKKEKEPKKKKYEKHQKHKIPDKLTGLLTFILMILFLYTYLAVNNEVIYDNPVCTDIGFFTNFGTCAVPTQPVVGWAIGLTFLFIIASYFYQSYKKKKPPKSKNKKYINEY